MIVQLTPHLSTLRRLLLTLLALLLASLVPAAVAEDAPIEELQKLMKTASEEVLSGKPDTMLAHTLPSVVAMLGGEEKAKEILTKGMESMTNALELMGFKIKSYTTGEPEKTHTKGNTTFVLLPTTMVAESDEARMTEKSHVLGIWNAGPDAKWYLLRLAMPEARVRLVVPDLPKDFTWPAKQKPVLEKR